MVYKGNYYLRYYVIRLKINFSILRYFLFC